MTIKLKAEMYHCHGVYFMVHLVFIAIEQADFQILKGLLSLSVLIEGFKRLT